MSFVQRATPAIVMAIGTGPFYWSHAPGHVQAGGACLTAIAMILADVQNGRKLGYTDQLLAALHQIPGMEKADEGTLLGALTLGASASLGIPATVDMAQNGVTAAGVINNVENYISFPVGAAFSFQNTRKQLELMLGKEFSFSYKDEKGEMKKSAPISTSMLVQQVAYLSGAAGILGMGTALDSLGIQFTGVMFGLANGISIKRLVEQPVGEVAQARLQGLADCLQEGLTRSGKQSASSAREHFGLLRQEWQEAATRWRGGQAQPMQDVKALGQRLSAALGAKAAEAVRPNDCPPRLPPFQR